MNRYLFLKSALVHYVTSLIKKGENSSLVVVVLGIISLPYIFLPFFNGPSTILGKHYLSFVGYEIELTSPSPSSDYICCSDLSSVRVRTHSITPAPSIHFHIPVNSNTIRIDSDSDQKRIGFGQICFSAFYNSLCWEQEQTNNHPREYTLVNQQFGLQIKNAYLLNDLSLPGFDQQLGLTFTRQGNDPYLDFSSQAVVTIKDLLFQRVGNSLLLIFWPIAIIFISILVVFCYKPSLILKTVSRHIPIFALIVFCITIGVLGIHYGDHFDEGGYIDTTKRLLEQVGSGGSLLPRMVIFIESWGILISVILLLFLCLFTTRRGDRSHFRKRYLLVFVSGLLSVVWIINIAADRELIFFDLRSDNLLRIEDFTAQTPSPTLGHEDNCHKLIHQISKGIDTNFVSTTCNVLIIDGSSISTRGVDGEILQSILNRQGYSVRVVQLTAIGAGHYERRSLVRRHLKQLEKFYSHPSVNLILMDEIHLLFDNDFLAGIRSNLLTEVSQGFIDLNTAILIVKNELNSGIDLVNKLSNDLNFYINLVREGLLRELHIGWYGRLLSPKQLNLTAKGHTPFGEVRNVEISLALTDSELTNSLSETCRYEISGSYSMYVPEVHSDENAVYCETGCTGYNFRLFEGINNEYKLSETPHKLFLLREFSGTTTYQHVPSDSDSLLSLGPVSDWKLLICLPSQPTITRNYNIKFNFLGLAAQSRGPSVFWDRQLIQKHIQEMIKNIPSSGATKTFDRPHDSTVLKRATLLRHQLMGGLIENVDHIGRYTTPTLLKQYRSYYDNSCRINSCLVEPQDLKEFVNSTYPDEWTDETHLSALGAYRFTTLLAETILEKNLLQ